MAQKKAKNTWYRGVPVFLPQASVTHCGDI